MNISKTIASNCVLLLTLLAIPAVPAGAAEVTNKWEGDIRAFEEADRRSPPPANAVLFVGSSSIRLWKNLPSYFPSRTVIQRGVGGCQMPDVLFYADRIVIPYRPKQIVVYAGDNDIKAGRSPEQVIADFKAFVETVRKKLPGVRISYIAIKPSPSRWTLVEKIRAANDGIRTFAASGENLDYLDIFTPMLGPDGKPREDLFLKDMLHLNEKGYGIWKTVIEPHLR